MVMCETKVDVSRSKIEIADGCNGGHLLYDDGRTITRRTSRTGTGVRRLNGLNADVTRWRFGSLEKNLVISSRVVLRLNSVLWSRTERLVVTIDDTTVADRVLERTRTESRLQ